jgi:hypothetical protein
MDEDVKQRVLGYLDAVAQKVNDASEKMPILAQEIVNQYFYGGLAFLGVSIVLIFLCLFCAKHAHDEHDNERPEFQIASFLTGVFGLTSLIVGSVNLFYALVCPNLLVLEKIMYFIQVTR